MIHFRPVFFASDYRNGMQKTTVPLNYLKNSHCLADDDFLGGITGFNGEWRA